MQIVKAAPASEDSFRVPTSRLSKEEHGALICYPGTDIRTFQSRVNQLKKLKIKELILEGDSKIGKYGVLGKGCVSIVVRARVKGSSDIFALKIRRVDANRPSMKNDYELQKFANSFEVGPHAFGITKDLFLMEYIDATKVGKWFRELKTRSSKKLVKSLVRAMLFQCFLLDVHGLDHGELSNPSKHILIRNDGRQGVVIIDYESASRARKTSNLTSVAQFLLFAGGNESKLRKILGLNSKKSFQNSQLIGLLRRYKDSPSEFNFGKILDYINC